MRYYLAIDIGASSGRHIVAHLENGKMITEEDMRFVLGKCCYGNGHEKLLADFYHCIKTGQHFTLDGTEASKVLKIIFAVYKNSGERESIEEP